MKLPLILTLASILAPAIAENANPTDKESTDIKIAAATLCTEVRRERIEGLPTPEQLQRLSPLITPELRAIFERARTLQAEQIRKQPDEKPDWIEGDLFSSLFEGVSTWALSEVFTAPTVDATVKVNQTYNEPNQKPVTWTDRLVFKLQGKHWLLNDILMGGKWDFSAGKTLRSRLPGGIKESDSHDSPDGSWHVTFQRDGNTLKSVTITEKKDGSKSVVLLGDKPDWACTFPTWLVWNTDASMFALRPGDSPRFTKSLVYRLVDHKWVPASMPEFYPKKKKTMAANGFRERENLNDAEYWQDATTLVIHYFSEFTNGDDGDGFDKLISVHIDENGKANVVESLDTPGEN